MRFLLIMLLLNITTLIYSQNKKYTSAINQNDFCYMLGKQGLPGYEPIQCSKNINNIVIYSNGKSAPILQYYVSNQKKYHFVENTMGEKTKIIDIKLFDVKATLLFIVSGEKFSMAFTLEDGFILEENDNNTTFYTENVGKWKIYK